MICGIEWCIPISRSKITWISKKFNLKVNRGYASRRECLIDDEEKTFRREGKYRNLIIEVRKDNDGCWLTVRGSLHKFYHGNNTGSFSGAEIEAAIQGVIDLFDIEPAEAVIKKLEVGINLPVAFPVYNYLNNNLLYYKKSKPEEYEKKGVGFFFKNEDHKVKLYQKDKHLLRFEIQYLTKKKLKSFGISTLSDLNEVTVNKLAKSLIPEWQEVMLRGGVDVHDRKCINNGLTEQERVKLIEFTSSAFQQSYCVKLKQGNRKEKDALRQQAYRLKKVCLEIIKRHGDNIHFELETMIKDGITEFSATWHSSSGRNVADVTKTVSLRERKRDNEILSKKNNGDETGIESEIIKLNNSLPKHIKEAS